VAAVLGSILAVTSLSGCASQLADRPGMLKIVTSNLIWNDVALQIGGSHVTGGNVLLDNPNIDPHEFQPSAPQRLMVQMADVAILTGTDYDSFMQPLLDAADFESDRVVKATKPVDKWGPTLDDNPHYWFDVASVKKPRIA